MTTKPEPVQSEQSLKHGGWGWRPQLQEWHKLVWLEPRDKRRGSATPTLLRRDVHCRRIKSLDRAELQRFNRRFGFTYGQEKIS